MTCRLIIALLSLSSALAFAAEKMEDSPPFKSTEDLRYVSKTTNPFSGVLRDDSYIGTVFRVHGTVEATQRLAVHQLKDAPIRLTADFCNKVVKHILYMRPEFPMKIEKTALFQARFGKACEVLVRDEDPSYRRRQVIISWINTKAYAFLVVYPQGAPTGQPDEIRHFIQSLR